MITHPCPTRTKDPAPPLAAISPDDLKPRLGDFAGRDALTRKEAAAMLGVTPDSLSQMICRAEIALPYVLMGKRKRIYSRRITEALILSRCVIPENAA